MTVQSEKSIGCSLEAKRVERMMLLTNPNITFIEPTQRCPEECNGPIEVTVMKRFALIGPLLPKVIEVCPLSQDQTV